MANIYSNIANPAQNALLNKLNPQPLQGGVKSSTSPVGTGGTKMTNANNIFQDVGRGVGSFLGGFANDAKNVAQFATRNTATPYVNPANKPLVNLAPPTNQDIKSHILPDGTTQTYYPSTTKKVASSTESTPPIPPVTPPNQNSYPPLPQVNADGSKTLPDGSKIDANGNLVGAVGGGTGNSSAPVSTYNQANQGLLNYGNGQNNNSTVTQANQGLVKTGQQAQDIAAEYGQKIAGVGETGANTIAGDRTTGTSPVGEGNAAVAAQTTAARQTALAQGEQAALQGTGQNISALNDAGGLGTSQQGQNIGALGTAGGLTAPLGSTPYAIDPTTGKVIGGGSVNSALINAGNLNTVSDFTQKYNQGKAKLAAADGIQGQIISTLQANPTLNSTPLSVIPNLNELLSGQISSGPQQVLSQQIANYIQTLGLDPASVTSIAHQQQGTLAQLLDSLRSTAQAQNEAYNPANVNTGGGSNSSGSYTSASGNSYNLPY